MPTVGGPSIPTIPEEGGALLPGVRGVVGIVVVVVRWLLDTWAGDAVVVVVEWIGVRIEVLGTTLPAVRMGPSKCPVRGRGRGGESVTLSYRDIFEEGGRRAAAMGEVISAL